MNENARERVDLTLDRDGMYREESYSDLRTGSIRRYVPVTADGADDPARPAAFVAETQIMTNMGPLPIEAPLQAKTLAEAIAEFPNAIQAALEHMAHEVQRRQREEASRIVVPGLGGPPPPDLKLR